MVIAEIMLLVAAGNKFQQKEMAHFDNELLVILYQGGSLSNRKVL